MNKPKTPRELKIMAKRMRSQGFDPVLIKIKGCPLKVWPHVCANCGERNS